MTDQTQLRAATLDEHASIEALFVRSSLSNERDRANLLENPHLLVVPVERIAHGQLFVAERGAVIVGFASVEVSGDGEMELEDMFVEPGMWRQGIGRSLVEHCVNYARISGCKALCVVGSSDAEGFYTACGFHVIGPYETLFGPALRMRKAI